MTKAMISLGAVAALIGLAGCGAEEAPVPAGSGRLRAVRYDGAAGKYTRAPLSITVQVAAQAYPSATKSYLAGGSESDFERTGQVASRTDVLYEYGPWNRYGCYVSVWFEEAEYDPWTHELTSLSQTAKTTYMGMGLAWRIGI